MIQRSKNGCLHCKKLKIKCNEARPKCEYCQHRNRECCYPDPSVKPDAKKRNTLVKKPHANQPRKTHSITTSVWESLFAQRVSELPFPVSSPDFERLFTMEETRSFNQFVYNETLFAPNLQLSMTKFEYNLLDFFHTFCIRKFCVGGSVEVEKIWKNHVPTLFLQSPLIRCSVFSFAALLILPRCDLNQLSSDNTGLEKLDFLDSNSSECTIFDPCLSSAQNLLNLHGKTVDYFLEAAKLTREVIGDDLTTKTANLRPHASELAISSMLIFSFLLLNPYSFIPLISWDRSEPDFISMAKGIMYTMHQCAPILLKSEFGGLFVVGRKTSKDLPKNCTFLLIRKLEVDFTKEYPVVHNFTAKSLREREAILGFLNQLKMLFYKLVGLTSPNAGFRWVVHISDEYQELLYEKNFFALRIIFVYAAVVLFRQYDWVDKDNMWLSFMRWYKQYNYDLYGGWKYFSDERLFSFAHDQNLRFKCPDLICTFDPEDPACEDMFAARFSR